MICSAPNQHSAGSGRIFCTQGRHSIHSHVDVLVGLLLNKVNIALQWGGGTGDLLLSDEALDKVYRSIFLVLDQHEDCVGGGFFYAPGKAVTADHNLLPEQR